MPGRLNNIYFLVILLFGLSSTTIQAGTVPVDAQGELPSLAPMLEHVLPGVVSIAVKGRMPTKQNPLLADPFFRRFFGIPEGASPQGHQFQAAGSGVIVEPEHGYIITNNHVVEHADEITVVLSDGRRLQAKKIGTDPATDIAVIQVHAMGLSGVPLGDSSQLKVGDYVVAVGNPFGLRQTVTSGIVSALGRTGLGIEGYEDFIQTDASINPGNSGGALVNLRGQLVGINTAIVAPSGANVGIGFAIPVDMAQRVMTQLIAYGKVRRGQLGVAIQNLTPDLAKALKIKEHEGALIARVVHESPAEKAGLKAGDVIVAVKGKKVRSATELRNIVGLLPVGSKVTLDVFHKGKRERVVAILAEPKLEKVVVSKKFSGLAGVTLGPIGPDSPLYGRVQGAVVLGIKKDSVAAIAGLEPGDVIVAVDQQPVQSPNEVVAIAEKHKGKLLLQVQRNGSALFIAIG